MIFKETYEKKFYKKIDNYLRDNPLIKYGRMYRTSSPWGDITVEKDSLSARYSKMRIDDGPRFRPSRFVRKQIETYEEKLWKEKEKKDQLERESFYQNLLSLLK